MTGLSDVVREGDRLRSLHEVRDKLADELQAAAGRDVATLAKELRAVLAEVESLAPVKEGSRFDELAARRARRVSDAESKPAAAGKRSRRGGSGGAGRPGGSTAG